MKLKIVKVVKWFPTGQHFALHLLQDQIKWENQAKTNSEHTHTHTLWQKKKTHTQHHS